MRALSMNESFAVNGGMIGAPPGVLCAIDTYFGTATMDTITVTTSRYGASDFLNDFVTGTQIAISDCANGAQVGGIGGAVLGTYVFPFVGTGLGGVAGGALGCIGNVGLGIIKEVTKPAG